MSSAMGKMGEVVARLGHHLPRDEFASVVSAWDAACNEHLEMRARFEDRVEEPEVALRAGQMFDDPDDGFDDFGEHELH